jgi:hypothetical protein
MKKSLEYSERELYEITQLARLKFLGEEVAKQVMTEDDLIIALMACLKYIDLKLKIDTEGKFKINGKWGRVCGMGGFILPLYEWISDFDEESFCRAKVSTKGVIKEGLLNSQGKLLGNQWYDKVWKFNDGFARVQIREKRNFINRKGVLLSEQWYDTTSISFSDDLIIVKLGHKMGFIDKDGCLLGGEWFSYVMGFVSGVARVARDGKLGFIDRNGILINNRWYDSLYDRYPNTFSKNLTKVGLDGKRGFVDKLGNFYDKRPN